MAKILSIIILIALIGGGGWYYTNNMKTPAEGVPVGYGSEKKDNKEDRYDNKFDNKSFAVTFPNASSTLIIGEKVNTTWNTGFNLNLKLAYPVMLVSVTDRKQKPVHLGNAKYSLVNKVFTWTVPATTTPGSYKIVFVGKKGGESEVFKVATSTTPVNNPKSAAIFSKVSSSITTMKTNNVDTGVSVDFRLNIQANGSDIYASGTTAVVVLNDLTSGKVITEKIVTVMPMEPGMMYFTDGVTKPISIQVVFPASIFSSAGSSVKASIYSINYTTVGSIVKPSATYTATDFGLYDTNVTAIIGTVPTVSLSFTRDLTLGSTGADVTLLQKTLLAKGFTVIESTGYFGETTKAAVAKYQISIGISPADGYFGAMTRAALNTELATPPTVSN